MILTPLLSVIALVGAGFVCLLAAVIVFTKERRIFEVVPQANVTIEVPKKWNDSEITQLLQRHHEQPAVLAHLVSSIKSRMILNQDLKTAQQRLKLMAGVIEVFKLNKELHGLLHDIHLEAKEFEIRQVEAQIRHEDADARLKSERQLRDLRKQRDQLQLQKEIAQLQQEVKTFENQPGPEPKLTAEQQRRLKRIEIEDKLRELDRLEEDALKTTRSDEDRVRLQNMYSDKREELRDQLARNLV